MTELTQEAPTGVGGRVLSARGVETRRRLLEAAEKVFSEHGYHDASIVKITESAGVGQGTFYLYFASKQEVFEEVVIDLNRRVRHTLTLAVAGSSTRAEAEERGFRAFFRFTADHPALYRVLRQAEFVSPHILQAHYERFLPGYVMGLRQAMDDGEVAEGDAELLAWTLMGVAELIGMRWVLWGDGGVVPEEQFAELGRLLRRLLGGPA